MKLFDWQVNDGLTERLPALPKRSIVGCQQWATPALFESLFMSKTYEIKKASGYWVQIGKLSARVHVSGPNGCDHDYVTLEIQNPKFLPVSASALAKLMCARNGWVLGDFERRLEVPRTTTKTNQKKKTAVAVSKKRTPSKKKATIKDKSR